MVQINPKPMKLVTEVIKPTKVGQPGDFDIPHLHPKHDDKVDVARYFRPPFNPKAKVTLERKIVFALLGALLILWIFQGIVMALNGFFGTYDVQVHPLFRAPFTIEKRVKPEVKGAGINPLSTPTVTMPEPTTKPAESQATPQPDRIAHFIWSIESGKGTAPAGWHVNCRAKGLWNEIGYGGPAFCFDSKDEGFAKLNSELVARIAKQGLKETLCVYNKGFNRDDAGNRIPHGDCDYYQKYLKSL